MVRALTKLCPVLLGTALGLAGCNGDGSASGSGSLGGSSSQTVASQSTPTTPPATPSGQVLAAKGRALIQKIYKGEKQVKDLTPEERKTLAALLRAAKHGRD